MKINQMGRWQAMERMGSEASDQEAEAMLRILRASGHDDTEDISDAEWSAMVEAAVEAGGAR